MTMQTGKIFRRLRRLPKSETGGALIELAIVLPVLILIAIGVMDYGRVYFTSVAVANAARAGAEFGSIEPGRETWTTQMQDFAKLDGAEAGAITVTATTHCECSGSVVACSTTCAGYGAPWVLVEVTASKSVAMVLKYPGLPTTVTVSRTAIFRAR